MAGSFLSDQHGAAGHQRSLTRRIAFELSIRIRSCAPAQFLGGERFRPAPRPWRRSFETGPRADFVQACLGCQDCQGQAKPSR